MVIEVEHLIKSYGTAKAVDDISFRVRQGEVFGMLVACMLLAVRLFRWE